MGQWYEWRVKRWRRWLRRNEARLRRDFERINPDYDPDRPR